MKLRIISFSTAMALAFASASMRCTEWWQVAAHCFTAVVLTYCYCMAERRAEMWKTNAEKMIDAYMAKLPGVESNHGPVG